MSVPLGQAIALTCYCNAYLAGHPISLELESHSWFNAVSDIAFGRGHDEDAIDARSPLEWFESFRKEGFKSAYLWLEPNKNGMTTIGMVGFADGGEWAPATVQPGLELIWHLRSTFKEEERESRPWHLHYGGYRVMPGQHSVVAEPDQAAQALQLSLTEMLQFASTHVSHEVWAERLEEALAIADSYKRPDLNRPVSERIACLFPAGLYPRESSDLVEAVMKGWVFGGMMWWNDASFSEPEVQSEFERVSLQHYDAMCQCLFAACSIKLAPVDDSAKA